MLCSHPTSLCFSDLLVNQIEHDHISSVLDLGAGEGALSASAMSRWKGAALYATEMDDHRLGILRQKFPWASIFLTDSLSPRLPDIIGLNSTGLDAGVCNPPFQYLPKSQEVVSVLRDGGLTTVEKLTHFSKDMVFLFQYLRMLRKGGYLSIVLPESIIANENFTLIREWLLSNHGVESILELPKNAFANIEAQTHILTLKKNGVSGNFVLLGKASNQGRIMGLIRVNPGDLVKRMDYSYHHWAVSGKNSSVRTISLRELDVQILRGRSSKKLLKSQNRPFLHTSDLCDAHPGLPISLQKNALSQAPVALPGDIILARVGTRCIGRVGFVVSGAATISDCLFIVRSHRKWQKKLLNEFISPYGKKWIDAHSKGVGASFLSKKDLLNFPLRLLNESG